MTCKDVYRVFFHVWLLTGSTVTSLCNVAPRGTSTQSSTYESYTASLANDGNSDPSYYNGSCSHTGVNVGQEPWWRLRLQTTYRISSVSITNRMSFASSRFKNVRLLIGNSTVNNGNDNPSCVVIASIPAGTTSTFNCGGMIGQFVNVYMNQYNAILTMCELKVYGDPNFPLFNAVVRGQNVVVVQKKLAWSDALFFCRDFYWDLLSIRSEGEQREVEEVLRATSSTLTKHLWMGLRRYMMEGTWFWMSGASVDYSYWERKSIWQNTSPCGGIDTRGHWKDLPCGDHLHFICLADCPEDDTRVKFFSSTRPTEQ